MFVELIATTVTSAASAEQSGDCEINAVARSLLSAAEACLGVQRVATGWSVNRVCATATGHVVDRRDNSTAGSSSTPAQPVWLDVPVVAAGLLIWARTHQEVVLQRYDLHGAERRWLGHHRAQT